MITIVRTKRIYNTLENGEIDIRSLALPAGKIWIFDSKEEVKDAVSFMWGKDINFYAIFRNGYDIKLEAELGALESNLNSYTNNGND